MDYSNFFDGCMATLEYSNSNLPKSLREYVSLKLTIKAFAKTHSLLDFIEAFELSSLDKPNIMGYYKECSL